MKVAVFSIKPFEKPYLEESNASKHELKFIPDALSVLTASLAKGCDAIGVFTNDDLSASVMTALGNIGIKYIATRAAGYDNIDLVEAEKLSIKVANVPEYSPYSIAEHTLAMILALNRKIVLADQRVKSSDFTLDPLVGFDLNGKTVGIIGLGKIGGIVAKILQGFGCNILGCDLYPEESFTRDFGVKYVILDELCSQSDIITLHTPLNAQTKNMINSALIAKMKTGVMIINTGRGALLNTSDAMDAVVSGKIGYLGLDVYEKEKGLFFYDHSANGVKDEMFVKLLSLPNVLVTGHQAFLTSNALQNIADCTISNLTQWQEKRVSTNDLVGKVE